MSYIKPISVLTFVLLLAGCASVKMREDTTKPPASKWQMKYDTQVAIGQCIFCKEPESALAGIGVWAVMEQKTGLRSHVEDMMTMFPEFTVWPNVAI